jgi:hypothetical protein
MKNLFWNSILGLLSLAVSWLVLPVGFASEIALVRARIFCPAGAAPIRCGWDPQGRRSCGMPPNAEYLGYFEAFVEVGVEGPATRLRGLRTCVASDSTSCWRCDAGTCVSHQCQQQSQPVQDPRPWVPQPSPTLQQLGERPWDGEDCSMEFLDERVGAEGVIAQVEANLPSRFVCSGGVRPVLVVPGGGAKSHDDEQVLSHALSGSKGASAFRANDL